MGNVINKFLNTYLDFVHASFAQRTNKSEKYLCFELFARPLALRAKFELLSKEALIASTKSQIMTNNGTFRVENWMTISKFGAAQPSCARLLRCRLKVSFERRLSERSNSKRWSLPLCRTSLNFSSHLPFRPDVRSQPKTRDGRILFLLGYFRSSRRVFCIFFSTDAPRMGHMHARVSIPYGTPVNHPEVIQKYTHAH